MVPEKELASANNAMSTGHKMIKGKEDEQRIRFENSPSQKTIVTGQSETEQITSSIKIKADYRSKHTAAAQPKIADVKGTTKIVPGKSVKVEKSTSWASTMRKYSTPNYEFEGIKVDTAPYVNTMTETKMENVVATSVKSTASATKRKLVSSVKAEKAVLAQTEIQKDPRIHTAFKRLANSK